MPAEHIVRISKLRESLGWAYLTVANNGDAVVKQVGTYVFTNGNSDSGE